MPVVHMDYTFLFFSGLNQKDESTEEEATTLLTVLVAYDAPRTVQLQEPVYTRRTLQRRRAGQLRGRQDRR